MMDTVDCISSIMWRVWNEIKWRRSKKNSLDEESSKYEMEWKCIEKI